MESQEPGLNEAISLINRYKNEASRGSDPSPQEVPKTVMQFWDKDPPRDVTTLLHRNRAICKESSIEWRFYDEYKAQRFLVDYLGEEVLDAFRRCPHPAIKADLFRICFLYCEGGLYLDADLVLRRSPAELLAKGRMVFFQRTGKPNENILNWFLIAPKKQDLYRRFLNHALRNIARIPPTSKEKAIGRTLGIAGPVVVTTELGRYIKTLYQNHSEHGSPVDILTLQEARRYVAHGPQYLGQPLSYKSDSRHWKLVQLELQVAELKEGIQRCPNSAALLYQTSTLLLELKRLDEAVYFGRRAAAVDSEEPRFQSHLVDLALALGDLNEAQSAQAKVVSLNPDSSEAHNRLSTLLLKRGRLRQAKDHARTAVKLSPQKAEYLQHLGLVYLRGRKLESAVEFLRKAIELQPECALAHKQLSVAYKRLGRVDEALKHARQAANLKPKNRQFQRHLESFIKQT